MTTKHRDNEQILALASKHGLRLNSELQVNELGLDFQVVIATDMSGISWVLRIPRRTDVCEKIEKEHRTLSFLRPQVPFAVPDWQIVSSELIAYPKLTGSTAIEFDLTTNQLTWNINKASPIYVKELGKCLAIMHGLSPQEAVKQGMALSTPDDARKQTAHDIETIRKTFTIAPDLEKRWFAWLENDSWSEHSTVVHGDLYAGHILVNHDDEITGIIDWTESEVGDPSIDFCSHLLLFGESGLTELVQHYMAAGGKTWPAMIPHIKERLALSPLKYALFALRTGDPTHLESAQEQLKQPVS